jgi:uncharacterized protein (DUF1810 family)
MPTTEEGNLAYRMRKLTKNKQRESELYRIRKLIEGKANLGFRLLGYRFHEGTSIEDDQTILDALVMDGFAVRPITIKSIEITW